MTNINDEPQAWDFSSDERFTQFYSEQSASERTWSRSRDLRDAILRLSRRSGRGAEGLDVLDVGCNAGTMCMVWAELDHRVNGVDINAPLLEIAGKRASEAGYAIDYRLGSATELPWPDESMDVCIALELLEHVEDWELCLKEFTRVLRPGGVLCVTTTNVLCPKQNEFTLPLYSWYPAPLKRHFVKLATTSRPDLANFATYPAVHWFSFYSLRRFLSRQNVRCTDQFEVTDTSKRGALSRLALAVLHAVPITKLLAFMLLTGTIVFGVKETRDT